MTRRNLRIVAIAGGIIAAMALLASCGNGDEDEGPVDVALSAIVGNEGEYDGRVLWVEGVVRGFGEGESLHYVVEDDDANRVQLLPNVEAEPFEEQEVRVVGRFSFGEETGRRIEIESIEGLD